MPTGLTWPAPWAHGKVPVCGLGRLSVKVGVAVVIMADLMAAGDQVGCSCLSSAAMPATCGDDIEVPSYSAQASGTGDRVPLTRLARWAAVRSGVTPASTFAPGAVRSGLSTLAS